MSNQAVSRLHDALHHLNKAQAARGHDAKAVHADTRALAHDKAKLARQHDTFESNHQTLVKHRTKTIALNDAKHDILDPLRAEQQKLQAKYDATVEPTTGLGDAALQAQLEQVTGAVAQVKAKYDPKLDAQVQSNQALKQTVANNRLAVQADRQDVKADRKDLKHDEKALGNAQDRVKAARKRALKDLKPAEYKMGLKATNQARHALGLKKVDHVIRPGVGNVTPTMRRLAKAGMSVAEGMGGYVSGGLCATGVCHAVQDTMGFYPGGNGNTIGNGLLASGKFKQVHISLAKALKIPGLVLSWQHTSTAAGSIYGHTAITTGDGHTSCSDFIERDTLAGAQSRTGLKIFMPIG